MQLQPSAGSRRRAPALVEREGALARLDAALGGARGSVGGAVFVGGPAGIGKTALLAATRARAVAAEMRVLRARGAELEGEFAFGIVRQLLEPLLAEASPAQLEAWLAGPAERAARLLHFSATRSASGADEDAPAPSFAVLHGLYWLCANVAASAPLCLIVDDAHWADVASLRFLAFLQPRLEELGIVVVLATRPGERTDSAPLIDGMIGDPEATLIELSPLSVDAVGVLLEAQLEADADPAFVSACHGATGGVPFLVGQLIQAIREDGTAPTADAVPRIDALGSRWAARWTLILLGRLPAEAAVVARALAVLETAEPGRVAALSGLSPGRVADAVDALIDAGILAAERPLRFVHSVVRRSVYDEIGIGQRAQRHREAAGVLSAIGAGDELVAEHLLAAEPAGDPWVSATLRGVARAAIASGAPETAITYLVRALAEPPPAGQRSADLLALGIAELSSGRGAAVSTLRRASEAAQTPAARLDAAMMLSSALGLEQRFDEALAVIDQVLAAGEHTTGRLPALLETTAVGIAMLAVDSTVSHRDRIRAARLRADEQADAGHEALALATLIAAQVNEPADTVAALATRAWSAAGGSLPSPGDLPWFEQLVASLVWAERPDQALPMLDAGIARARITADAGLFAACLGYRGLAALQRGDLGAADADVRSVLESDGLQAPSFYRTVLTAIAIETLVERGDLQAAEERLQVVADEVEQPHSVAAWLRLSRSRLRLAQHRADEALIDAVAAGEVALAHGFDAPGWLPWRPVAARAALLGGDTDAAARHAEAGVALARAFGASRTLGVALHAAGMCAGGRRGETLLREALVAHQRAGARLETARTLTELGALLRRGNRRVQARDVLRDALDMATRLRAQPLAIQAEAELRATGARPRRVVLTGLESLTASERRVAELAAEGLVNREIAQTLFVTARTVEGHLTSVFRKLDVAARGELPAALAGSGA